MRTRVGALLLTSALLAACGGGGGGAPAPVPPPPTNPPPTIASVSGKVVDDASGSALAGVTVGLAPWVADATPTPEGTTAPDGTFAFTAQPGHYLLVIGSNSPTDVTRATVHDNITLVAGANALHAPTLPPIPATTPPASETSGNYRLATLDATTEVPCIVAFNQARVARALTRAVADEWLTENSRELAAYFVSPNYVPGLTAPGNPYGSLTTGNTIGRGYITKTGESACQATMVDSAFSTDVQYATSLHTPWVGGSFVDILSNRGNDAGSLQYPIDPRFQVDPNVPSWP